MAVRNTGNLYPPVGSIAARLLRAALFVVLTHERHLVAHGLFH